jgi:hypothetical protein
MAGVNIGKRKRRHCSIIPYTTHKNEEWKGNMSGYEAKWHRIVQKGQEASKHVCITASLATFFPLASRQFSDESRAN